MKIRSVENIMLPHYINSNQICLKSLSFLHLPNFYISIWLTFIFQRQTIIIMQKQDQLTFAYQLGQNTISTSLVADHQSMQFYCSVYSRDNSNQSCIYKLNYSEDQPRKSQVVPIQVDGHLGWLKSFGFEQNTLMFANFAGNSIRKIPLEKCQKGNRIDPNQLDLIYQSQSLVSEVQKGKDSSILLSLESEIVSVDMNKQNKADSVKKIQQGRISHFAIDPARGYLTYTVKNEIFITDKSSGAQKYSFKVSPRSSDFITNINYNPNKQYYLMTGHHDFIKFWDIRKSNIPVKIVQEHHSLLLNTQYNPAHDELIIACYDDGSVGLYRLPSVSSNPSNSSVQFAPDVLVKSYDQHEDSVYHACWSHSPWIFASVSQNASNIVVNIVPSAEKYRILL